MAKEDKKLMSITATGVEMAELATSGLAAAVASLPLIYDPIKFLIGAGAVFSAGRIVKMGSDVQDFFASKAARRAEEREGPHRKLFETLRFLHNTTTLDDDFIDALRNLHILTFAADTDQAELTEIYLLLETARKLSGPEILTLLSAYRIHNGLYRPQKMQEIVALVIEVLGGSETRHAKAWLRMITKACDYSSSDYVEYQQEHLEELLLIAPRDYAAHRMGGKGSEFSPTGRCRLTESGYRLSEFITRGNKLYEEMRQGQVKK